ncbi:MAG TPA: carboxypeptidase-like regulatory domain-containing protein [Thermoanaerobaculia bacterium]|jgi:hypothetical protein
MTALLGFLALTAAFDANIPLSPPRAIFVNVVNRDLAPVPGAMVSLRRPENPDGEPVKSAAANAGGRVEFRDLPAGSYLVRIEQPGHVPMTLGPVAIEEKDPPSVRLPVIVAVLNPILSFS